MAQRYGGKYSLNNDAQSSQNSHASNAILTEPQILNKKRQRRLSIYRYLTYPIAFAGALRVLSGESFQALIIIASALLLLFSYQIMKAGLIAEAAYHARNLSRAPRFPRKLIASILTGVSFGALSYISSGQDWLAALAAGAFGMVAMIFANGVDPLRSKGFIDEPSRETERAYEALQKAEQKLNALKAHSEKLNKNLQSRVNALSQSAQKMFRAIEARPSEFRQARRYLGIYLQGAEEATEQYLALPSPTAEQTQKFDALLFELTEGFNMNRERLESNHSLALDVEIDVLRERLASEGISSKEI